MSQTEAVPQFFFGDAADSVQEMHAGDGKHQMVRYNPQAISFIRNNYINEQLRKRYVMRNSACRHADHPHPVLQGKRVYGLCANADVSGDMECEWQTSTGRLALVAAR